MRGSDVPRAPATAAPATAALAALLDPRSRSPGGLAADARFLRLVLAADGFAAVAAAVADADAAGYGAACGRTLLRDPPRFMTLSEWQLDIADAVIGGYGIECAGDVDPAYGPPLEYVNIGDCYRPTLCRLRVGGPRPGCRHVWRAATVGDIIENRPRLFGRR